MADACNPPKTQLHQYAHHQVGTRMATLTDTQLDQALTVEQWRYDVLLEAGYPKPLAKVIAMSHTIDLHQAVRMVHQGCDPILASKILL
jgi:hypothetical protein